MGKGKGGLGGLVAPIGEVTKTSFNWAQDAWGDVSGSNAAAKAAERAAGAQAAAANSMRGQALDYASKMEADLANMAKATPQELRALDQSLAASEANLAREQKLLSAIDPALMEASKQALSLLRGENAAVNNPLMAQRNSQRQSLINSLRAQYGPGAESSSIGQRALRQFDMESNSMFQQNQQNSLAQMFGMATSDAGGRNRLAIESLMGVGQGYGNIQNRLLNARSTSGNAMMQALTGTAQPVINAAGSQYAGDVLRAQSRGQFANLAARAGIGYMSGGMSEAGGLAGGKGSGGGGTPGNGFGGDMSSIVGSQSAMSHGGSFGQRGM